MNETNSNKSARRWTTAGASALLVAGLLALSPWSHAKDNTKPAPLHVVTSETPVPQNGKLVTSYAPIVKKVAPSVVKVSVVAKPKMTPSDFSGWITDLRRFFGGGGGDDDFWGAQPQRQQRMPKQHGIGSGVIITKDGYILTNNHVVENADTVTVALNDSREYSAKVIGRDPQTDIAVVKIDAKDLPFLTLADSDKIEVGDVVLAVGNPFGIGQTVTTGIVSAKGRATLGLDYEDFIQTDAAINPGNSGGALVDTEGRLIGINTAILSRTGGNQGIGFAVPTNLAHWVVDSLVKNGKVERSFMGVMIQDFTPQLAKQFKMDHTEGALVSEVTPRGPADKAGILSGDVIVEFDGKPVADSRHLKLQVGASAPGASIPVKIVRDGSTKTLHVTLKEAPGDKMAKASNSPAQADDALHGVGVADLDDASRSQFRIPQNVKGAIVSEVDPDSVAYEAGLRQGDVIVEINRKPIKNARQAEAATEKADDKRTLVKVWSHGGTRYVVVDETNAG